MPRASARLSSDNALAPAMPQHGLEQASASNLALSQKLLGHRNREMTEHHVRRRVGERGV